MSGSEETPGTARKARSSPPRWVVGLLIGGALVLVANFVFIYIAVTGADQVVPSYNIEHR